jgi:hypothetical protein
LSCYCGLLLCLSGLFSRHLGLESSDFGLMTGYPSLFLGEAAALSLSSQNAE